MKIKFKYNNKILTYNVINDDNEDCYHFITLKGIKYYARNYNSIAFRDRFYHLKKMTQHKYICFERISPTNEPPFFNKNYFLYLNDPSDYHKHNCNLFNLSLLRDQIEDILNVNDVLE